MIKTKPLFLDKSITSNAVHELYTCPYNVTHANIDVSYVSNGEEVTFVTLYILPVNNDRLPTPGDVYCVDIPVAPKKGPSETTKILLGPGETLMVKTKGIKKGDHINCFVTGQEVNHPHVARAGRLYNGKVIAGINNELIRVDNLLAGYASATLRVLMMNDRVPGELKVYVSRGKEPQEQDHIATVIKTPLSKKPAIVKLPVLKHFESVFVTTDTEDNFIASLNGVVIRSSKAMEELGYAN